MHHGLQSWSIALSQMLGRLVTRQGVSVECSRRPWRDVLDPVLTNNLIGDSRNKALLAKDLSIASSHETAGVLADLRDQDAACMKRPAGDAMLQLLRLGPSTGRSTDKSDAMACAMRAEVMMYSSSQ